MQHPKQLDADLQFTNCGSFALMVPMTPQGGEWVRENCGYDVDFNGGVPVEHRYLADVVNGARDAGLICYG